MVFFSTPKHTGHVSSALMLLLETVTVLSLVSWGTRKHMALVNCRLPEPELYKEQRGEAGKKDKARKKPG